MVTSAEIAAGEELVCEEPASGHKLLHCSRPPGLSTPHCLPAPTSPGLETQQLVRLARSLEVSLLLSSKMTKMELYGKLNFPFVRSWSFKAGVLRHAL